MAFRFPISSIPRFVHTSSLRVHIYSGIRSRVDPAILVFHSPWTCSGDLTSAVHFWVLFPISHRCPIPSEALVFPFPCSYITSPPRTLQGLISQRQYSYTVLAYLIHLVLVPLLARLRVPSNLARYRRDEPCEVTVRGPTKVMTCVNSLTSPV